MLWSAVGLLMVVEFATSYAAVEALTDLAWCLGVPSDDVAAYVLWTGTLPV